MATIKVYHVEINGCHYYFGSKKAIFQNLSKESLGISYNSFRNVKDLGKVPFKNKKCTIREGILQQTSTNRGYKKSEIEEYDD